MAAIALPQSPPSRSIKANQKKSSSDDAGGGAWQRLSPSAATAVEKVRVELCSNSARSDDNADNSRREDPSDPHDDSAGQHNRNRKKWRKNNNPNKDRRGHNDRRRDDAPDNQVAAEIRDDDSAAFADGGVDDGRFCEDSAAKDGSEMTPEEADSTMTATPTSAGRPGQQHKKQLHPKKHHHRKLNKHHGGERKGAGGGDSSSVADADADGAPPATNPAGAGRDGDDEIRGPKDDDETLRWRRAQTAARVAEDEEDSAASPSAADARVEANEEGGGCVDEEDDECAGPRKPKFSRKPKSSQNRRRNKRNQQRRSKKIHDEEHSPCATESPLMVADLHMDEARYLAASLASMSFGEDCGAGAHPSVHPVHPHALLPSPGEFYLPPPAIVPTSASAAVEVDVSTNAEGAAILRTLGRGRRQSQNRVSLDSDDSPPSDDASGSGDVSAFSTSPGPTQPTNSTPFHPSEECDPAWDNAIGHYYHQDAALLHHHRADVPAHAHHDPLYAHHHASHHPHAYYHQQYHSQNHPPPQEMYCDASEAAAHYATTAHYAERVGPHPVHPDGAHPYPPPPAYYHHDTHGYDAHQPPPMTAATAVALGYGPQHFSDADEADAVARAHAYAAGFVAPVVHLPRATAPLNVDAPSFAPAAEGV